MEKRRIIVAGGVAALAVGAVIGLASGATAGGSDPERPITGQDLERASRAALAHTGGGTVSQTEDGDEESRYEVEVRLPDGSSVDVQLDDRFHVVGDKADDDRSEGPGAPG